MLIHIRVSHMWTSIFSATFTDSALFFSLPRAWTFDVSKYITAMTMVVVAMMVRELHGERNNGGTVSAVATYFIENEYFRTTDSFSGDDYSVPLEMLKWRFCHFSLDSFENLV